MHLSHVFNNRDLLSAFSCSAAACGSSDIFSILLRNILMVVKTWSLTLFSLSTVSVHRAGSTLLAMSPVV